jgi:acyl-CoA thioesterase
MGALDADTALEGGDGRYRAHLSEDWRIWGPNGGYLSVLALRAAGAHTPFRRPASFSCHFLGVADFTDVELTVRTLRRTKRAESVAVSMTQHGEPVLEAIAWIVGELDGLRHQALIRPEVPAPADLRPFEELLSPGDPVFPFWDNLELRPVDWIVDWMAREPGVFSEQNWYRFRPAARFADPFLDAGRSLLVLDTVLWPVASRGHPENTEWYAPSIDVQVSFHALAPDDEWLLADSCSPAAADGLVGGTAAIWSESGRLLATGGQQMLCRPAALNPSPEWQQAKAAEAERSASS